MSDDQKNQARRNHPAGKGIPESPEVAQHRMDLEAIDVANNHHDQ